jgi:hypothetical protein
VDLNQLLHRHQISLMQRDRAESAEERRAHSQFASDYADKIQIARDALGAPAHVPGTSGERAAQVEPSNNQSAHAPCVTARVVLMPLEDLPYTVVMSHDCEESSRHSFRTMREAETHVRRIMPTPAPPSTLYDRESGEV